MIARDAHANLLRTAAEFPAVALTGPRQSGKTTLVRDAFADKPYVSLEDPDVRAFADADARGFLGRFGAGAILDEIQRAPGLLSYLQTIIDGDRRLGVWVLTGSQQFGLREQLSQSLAGRVGLVQLWPFSSSELLCAAALKATLPEALLLGGYPPLFDRPVRPHVFFSSYVATYVERDVRQALEVRDLAAFQRFVRMCAARTAQLLNLSALAADCGITHNTARAWLSVLQASGIVVLLQPFFRNVGKRLVKTPKLYLTDSGLAAWLCGIDEPRLLEVHALRGALFESWVVAELHKAIDHRGLNARLSFWRDSSGHEVDVIVEHGGQLTAIEVKSGQTVAGDWLGGLHKLKALLGGELSKMALVYGGDSSFDRQGVAVMGWREAGLVLGGK
ncbi:MAG: ATP-binding protein [Deltaproteobacteria bacterium]|nr:ATP-binding protein [Deltaproteobacteria bacterium]